MTPRDHMRFHTCYTRDPNTGCWVWSRLRTEKGYGLFFPGGEKWRAHRWSIAYLAGTDPEGHLVLHACDNPSCVNPDHLSVGTVLDNRLDMLAKGRGVRKNAALTYEQVADYKALRGRGMRRMTAARELGLEVCKQTLIKIDQGKIWTRVPGPAPVSA